MNKEASFLLSAVAPILAAIIGSAVGAKMDTAALLIMWYMLWKLFHDKNKD